MKKKRKKEVVVYGFPNRFMTTMIGIAGVAFLFTLFLSTVYNSGTKGEILLSPGIGLPGDIAEGMTPFIPFTTENREINFCISSENRIKGLIKRARADCGDFASRCLDYSSCTGYAEFYSDSPTCEWTQYDACSGKGRCFRSVDSFWKGTLDYNEQCQTVVGYKWVDFSEEHDRLSLSDCEALIC